MPAGARRRQRSDAPLVGRDDNGGQPAKLNPDGTPHDFVFSSSHSEHVVTLWLQTLRWAQVLAADPSMSEVGGVWPRRGQRAVAPPPLHRRRDGIPWDIPRVGTGCSPFPVVRR